MRLFPALELTWNTPEALEAIDRVLAALDDHAPTAVEDLAGGVRVFFASAADRDRAWARAGAVAPAAVAVPRDVPDDDWAARSQSSLRSIRVGRVVVSPPWDRGNAEGAVHVIIQPSMGFGTGHHASTRLCLQLLQSIPLHGASVLDVGTGSGVLAIAAVALGAMHAVGIDHDPDALQSARENLDLNGAGAHLDVRQVDLDAGPTATGGPFDVVLANLTGAVLMRQAGALRALLGPRGSLIASGIELQEADAVAAALGSAEVTLTRRVEEQGWVGLRLQRAAATSPSGSTAR